MPDKIKDKSERSVGAVCPTRLMDNKSIVLRKMEKIRETCHALSEKLGCCIFNHPASKEEIKFWEQENELCLPDDFKDMLISSNGMTIDGRLVKIFPLKQIKSYENISKEVPDDFIVIGNVIGDGEELCLSKKSRKYIVNDHGDYQEYNDFADFLDWVIKMLGYTQ